jgi:hypothetical protein
MQSKSSNGKKSNKSSNKQRLAGTTRRVAAPVATGLVRKAGVPTMRASPNGSTIIAHTEYFAEVTASSTIGAFAVTQYAINPGSAVMFPWLSTIAPSYESYRIQKLSFNFEPSVATSTAGVVQLAVDYIVKDSAPSTKLELMSNAHAVRSPPYASSSYHLDQKDAGTLGTRRFVRSGAVPSGTDPKTYDVGNFLVATSGFAAASTVAGELYVSYIVELITPQLDQASIASAISAKVVSGAAGVDKTHVFGTGSATVTGDLPVTATVNTMTFQTTGEFLIETQAVGTGVNTLNEVPTITGGTSAVASAIVANAAATYQLWSRVLKITSVGATLVWDFSGATTISAVTCRISKYAYANA